VKRFAVAALALAGCFGAHDVVVGDLREVVELPAVPDKDLDILFVIDNSASMADKQQSLADNFPRLVEALDTLDIGQPNYHIGVVTSDMGTASLEDVPAPPVGSGIGACGGTGDNGLLQHDSPDLHGTFISVTHLSDGTVDKNFDGDLETVFSDIAKVGDVGCGFEQHFSAMQRAFENTQNDGFLRDDANLAVVILADEDDCSLSHGGLLGFDDPSLGPLDSYRCTKFGVVCDPDDPDHPNANQQSCRPRSDSPYVADVQPFADALVALKGDPRKVMVATIAGDARPFSTVVAPPPNGGTDQMQLSPSCTFSEPDGSTAIALPGVRFDAFTQAFPGRGTSTSICNADLSGALDQIGQTTKRLVGDPCLSDTADLVDNDPDKPGLQPGCETLDVRDSAPDQPTELPACDASRTTDCYAFVADEASCPATPDHLRVQITRSHAVTSDTWTHVRCVSR
jgi:hypothetical protein